MGTLTRGKPTCQPFLKPRHVLSFHFSHADRDASSSRSGAVWPGVLILGAGIVCNVVIPPELKKLRQERSQACSSWRIVQDAWTRQPGNKQYLEIKRAAEDLIRALADLPNEERRGIQLLEQKKKEAQLNRHLDRFLIAHAKIRKIGSGRKAVLASFGIETAADIDPRKISSIQGFGPSLISELMAWRQTQVSKFVFNPNEPVSQGDLSALKSKIAASKVHLENQIRLAAANLQQASNSSLEQRKKILASANQGYSTLKQAELNEAAVTGPIHKASKFISLCCAAIAAVGLSLTNPYRGSVDASRPVTFPSKTPQNSSPPLSQNSAPPKSSPSGQQGTTNIPGPSNSPRAPSPPPAGAPPSQSVPSPSPWPNAPSPWPQQSLPRSPSAGPVQTAPSASVGSTQNSELASSGSKQGETQSPSAGPKHKPLHSLRHKKSQLCLAPTLIR
jgi:hypothetical protein